MERCALVHVAANEPSSIPDFFSWPTGRGTEDSGGGYEDRSRDYVPEINNNNIVHLKSDKIAFVCTFNINFIESRLSICAGTNRIQ